MESISNGLIRASMGRKFIALIVTSATILLLRFICIAILILYSLSLYIEYGKPQTNGRVYVNTEIIKQEAPKIIPQPKPQSITYYLT